MKEIYIKCLLNILWKLLRTKWGRYDPFLALKIKRFSNWHNIPSIKIRTVQLLLFKNQIYSSFAFLKVHMCLLMPSLYEINSKYFENFTTLEKFYMVLKLVMAPFMFIYNINIYDVTYMIHNIFEIFLG